ncbi:MAG TPA: hypothetical protein ENJ82_00965 [Bacteroidetes bacterium]|nr:hypothetical protein [Bacteroidota bacterium]
MKPEKASLTQFWDGGQTIDQTTAPSDNIKLCYNTSQGTNSIPTPQRFRPDFKLRNAMFPAILALKGSSRYWPVTPGSPVPPGFKPKIGDSFKLKVFIKNPNGIKSCSCDLTYYKGYLRYYFCIRRKAAPGSTGTPQGVRVPAEGWTKEEAKAKALKLLRVTESTHTIKEVGFKGSCL